MDMLLINIKAKYLALLYCILEVLDFSIQRLLFSGS
jgi:hypothetical protein